jgi:hypothetical protein
MKLGQDINGIYTAFCEPENSPTGRPFIVEGATPEECQRAYMELYGEHYAQAQQTTAQSLATEIQQ